MQEITEQAGTLSRQGDVFYPADASEKEIIYPEQREDDMGETSIHAKLISGFLQLLMVLFEAREDVFLTSNMNLYYVEGDPNKWYAPDILVAFGVPNHERPSYRVWEEGTTPQVIFEVSSERTWKADVSEKLEAYGRLGVEEYYILDPEFAYLPASIMAFHGEGHRLLSVAVSDDRIFSPRLGLEIVNTGSTFRLFDPKKGEFLRTLEEAENEVERLRAEVELLKAEK